jgi:uncharacterized membrane-anchored protein YitT (DUF2179 family)
MQTQKTSIKSNQHPIQLKDILFTIAGIFSAAFGLESFLIPNRFIDGGATGIALLVSDLTKLHLGLLLAIINIPFIYLAYKVINKAFAIKAAITILILTVVVSTIHFPQVTQEKLLVAVFGGFFLGAGIGLTVRGGAVLDGTEVLAIYVNKKTGISIGDIIILINIIVFSFAAYLISIETALYSMITYMAASKTLDFAVEGIEEYTGVTIISSKYQEITQMIVTDLNKAVTHYNGKRGVGKEGPIHQTEIIYLVITRLELNRLKAEVSKIDEAAFLIMSSVKDTHGGIVKKRAYQH